MRRWRWHRFHRLDNATYHDEPFWVEVRANDDQAQKLIGFTYGPIVYGLAVVGAITAVVILVAAIVTLTQLITTVLNHLLS